jgi:prepilin-type N-terminal cleavage/methylation domain-containing protein
MVIAFIVAAEAAMQLYSVKRTIQKGFTLAEVLVSIGVVAMFGMAVFATNQRLIFALKSQKETTAATTALQWRMETFRATSFSNIATAGTGSDYVKTNILAARTATDSNNNTVDPFAPLGSITEQFIIGVYPSDGSTPTVMSWDANHQSGQYVSQNTNLSSATLLKVDVLETWTSANGRQRQRQLSTIVGIGNVGQ